MSTEIKEVVRQRYAEAATSGTCCCGGSDCGDSDPITRDLYDELQRQDVPAAALEASLGCGNPTALAELAEGETILDLGSGGGIDVILSARRVGPTGRAIGVDMTDEMLALAHRNAAEAGIPNVEFRKGEIEALPLIDGEVDVVISNCVINLSVDKPKVLAEAFRVLKPGGRFAVSDVVVRGEIPPEVRKSLEMWAGCVAGALEEDEYRNLLSDAGFEEIEVEPTRIYEANDVEAVLEDHGIDVASRADALGGRLMSAFIRARKPIA
ncbi:MAG: arsenite methyltransferase [marine benthic group bacterium]|jgi:SAM-dependent methyltransferase|nr:arsenite methyltransferase [Gemmatimonadota bacterium]MCL7991567.1 arsenite methyltransferase [Gemmatimonadota bacterium]